MEKKKNDDVKQEAKQPVAESKQTAASQANGNEQEPAKAKRAPQWITPNGDAVSHAHVYKSNKSDDWFFVAKINDLPLKPQLCAPEDVEKILSKNANVEELMKKYYPQNVGKRLTADDLKVPCKLMANDGSEMNVVKFNIYKERDMMSPEYGKYRFYAQVDDMRMSAPASKAERDAYFNRTARPQEIIARVFGERLGLKAHYEQFSLPEGVNIKDNDIRLIKNKETNRFEISAKIEGVGYTPKKEISYDDRQNFFSSEHIATKQQLAAKYLTPEIMEAMKQAPAKKQELQPSLKI